MFAYKHIFEESQCLRLYYPKTEFLPKERTFHFFKEPDKIRVVPLDIKDELNQP